MFNLELSTTDKYDILHSTNRCSYFLFSQKKAVTIPDEIWSAATESGVSNVDFSKNLLEDIPLK